MPLHIQVERKKASKTRKLPFLPRLGIYLDVGGREIIYKQAPVLETVMNLKERGMSIANLFKIAIEQMAEIEFPAAKKGKTINTSARTVSVQRKKR
jgi:hypothetical protein